MDCRTARFLLDFAHPPAHELEPEEANALEQHLDHCPECHGLARGERRLDEQLGKAMRQVEVPPGLRDQILTRLEIERHDWYRRRFAHGLRIAAAVAAVLLLGWTAWRLAPGFAPPVDPERVHQGFLDQMTAGERKQQAEEVLKHLGVDGPLTDLLNYDLLSTPPSLSVLPGYGSQRVPQLVFDQGGPPHRHAVVYIIDPQQRIAPPENNALLLSGHYKLETLSRPGERHGYLVLHNGENLDWILSPQQPPT
jgi:hypothetical protein